MQARRAHGYLAGAEASAWARSAGPGDRWGLAAAALAEARALVESAAGGPWTSPSPTHPSAPITQAPDSRGSGVGEAGDSYGSSGSCAELARATIGPLLAFAREWESAEALDAFRAVLIALEWIEERPTR